MVVITNDFSWAFFESSQLDEDNHISNVDIKGAIGVKKKQYTFHKKKKKTLDVDIPMSRIDNLLYEESIQIVQAIVYCSLNCFQYFLCKKNYIDKIRVLEFVL